MSADPRTIEKPEAPANHARLTGTGRMETKTPTGDTLPRETEKEKIKRQLYNLIDRVDKL